MSANLSLNDSNTTGAPPGEVNTILREPWLIASTVPAYIIIFLLGVVGNSLVVYVVAANKNMQTITNIFITNLAISDIMICLLAVPFTPAAAFMGNWIFGDVICHILPMTLGVSVFVSTLTSTAIAVDRYFVIVYPFKPRMQTWVCMLLIVFIWIISISIFLPLAIYQRVKWIAEENVYYCSEVWPDRQSRKFFTITTLLLQYVVPCTIITFCYSKVSHVLKMRSRAKIGSGSKSREKEEIEIKRKRRTNKMLVAMVSIFVVCWMPLNTIHMLNEVILGESYFEKWYWFTLVFFIAHIIAMSSTIYNPFLYAWMNDNFRKEFKQIVPCLFLAIKHDSKANGNATQYTEVEQTCNPIQERSPMKERNGNRNDTVNIKPTHAHFKVDSEKVHLKVSYENEDV